MDRKAAHARSCTCEECMPRGISKIPAYIADEFGPAQPTGPGIAPIVAAAPAVGDVNSNAKGSGARYNAGKPPLHMIPLHLLEGACRVFQKATQKPVNPYPKWNWAKGMPWSIPLDCIKRHIAAIERGEDLDPETGELHIDHVLCNVVMLRHYYNAYREGDDRCGLFRQEPTK